MKNLNTEVGIPNESTSKFQEQTPITILIQDLEASSNLIESDIKKFMVLTTVKVIKESYVEREREIITKFAFDFYTDLSRQMGVPEIKISKNLTNAESYFDKKFNNNKDV